MSNGVFRYDLSGVVARKVPGRYGFIVQSNTKRYTHRRKPAKMDSLKQPFDPTLFNFNAVKPEEVNAPYTHAWVCGLKHLFELRFYLKSVKVLSL